MRRNPSIKRFVVLCLAGFLMAAPYNNVFAQEDTEANNETQNTNQELSESDIIDDILNRMAKEGVDPKYGPRSFKEVTLHATKKKVYIPLWFDEQTPKNNPDPFRPIIKKELPQRPVQPPVVTPQPNPQPNPTPRKVIPPLEIFVKGIVGNEDGRYAIIDFEKDEKIIRKDQTVEGKFKVIDIHKDRIVVYSNAEQRRYTFKIGGEGKGN